MFKSKTVASMAAMFLFSGSFLTAYAITGTASAQTRAFEAPVVVAPELAAPVETRAADSLSSDMTSTAAAESASSESIADSMPDAAPPASLDRLVADWDEDDSLDAETRCVATAVFYEARSESLAGQLAVANVIIQRTRSGRFPGSMCGVVKQPGQFGFVRGGRMPGEPANSAQWRTAKAIARIALDERWHNPVEGALYFHTARNPDNWDRERVAHIGGHVFYR